MKSILTLLLIAFVASETLVGGWVKRSYEENDYNLERARVAAEKKFYEEQKANERAYLITPISVYSQLVNGINFQFIFAVRNRESNDFKMYSYIVYSGPFSEKNSVPQVTSMKEIPKGRPLTFASYAYTDLHKAIGKFYSESNGLNHISTLYNYESPIQDLKIFVAIARVGDDSKEKTCVIIKENGEYQQVAEVKSF